jgi:hypothetical protein
MPMDNAKIAHEHESVPFYMDGSFKAAVDLTPGQRREPRGGILRLPLPSE